MPMFKVAISSLLFYTGQSAVRLSGTEAADVAVICTYCAAGLISLSVLICVVRLSSNHYSYSFSLVLTKLGTQHLCVNMQENCGTEFRYYEFELFGIFLKFVIWNAPELCRAELRP